MLPDDYHEFSNAKLVLKRAGQVGDLFNHISLEHGIVILDPGDADGSYSGTIRLPSGSTGGIVQVLSRSNRAVTFTGDLVDLSGTAHASSLVVGIGGQASPAVPNWWGGTVAFNGEVRAGNLEVHSGYQRTTVFGGQVSVQDAGAGRTFLDGNDSGLVRFRRELSTRSLLISGGRNIFERGVSVIGPGGLSVFDPVDSLLRDVRDSENEFQGRVDVSGGIRLGSGATYFGGDLYSSGPGGEISVGFDNSTFQSADWSAVYGDDYGYYLYSEAEMILRDRIATVTARSLNVRNGGSLRLERDVALQGNLVVNGSQSISLGPHSFRDKVGGRVDLGTHTLSVGGDASFGGNSILVVSRAAYSVGLLEVKGTLTLEGDVRLVIDEQASHGMNQWNSTVVTFGVINYSKSGRLVLPGDSKYELKQIGNSIVLADGPLYYPSAASYEDGVSGGSLSIPGADGAAASGTGGDGALAPPPPSGGAADMLSDASPAAGANAAGGAALADAVLDGPVATPQLAESLSNYLDVLGRSYPDNPAAVEQAMTQLAGGEALSSAAAAEETAQLVSTAVSSRFAALHEGADGAPAAGFGDTLNRVWMSAFGNRSRQKRSNGVQGFTYRSFGIVLGYDREFESLPGLTAGLSAAWSDGELRNDDGFAKTGIRTFNVGLYSSYRFRGGFFVDALAGYGITRNDAEIVQMVGGARKRASYGSDSFQAGLNLGYGFRLTGAVRFTPSIGLNYLHIDQDGWQETVVADPAGTGVANWFGGTRRDFLEIPAMLTLKGRWETASGTVFSPEIRAGAGFALDRPGTELEVGFVGSGRSTVIRGNESSRTRFQGGVSLGIQVNDTVDVFLDYNAEARRGFVSHSGGLGIGFSF
ncbi:MAG: autotransporter outer membrane beta-barrel domain-containing protein [Deltaproteobacteria bacterium]|nr:autotransporter outer membrane beta-barrel domain-containing protein [Deltaproteobacteria bacterium]